jgi:pilus assembly protein Flp/PilA
MGWEPAHARIRCSPLLVARGRKCAESFGKTAFLAQRTAIGACRGTAVAIWPAVTRRRAALVQTTCGDAATAHGDSADAQSSGEDPMLNLINFVKSFSNQEDGQDLLEYALLVALIALIAIGAVGMAGGAVSTIFTNIADKLTAAA